MSETLTLLAACLAGGALGAIFFGGLWWTVQRGVSSKHPALWFIGSLLLRTGITLTGFYFVSGSRWGRMAACLAGFILARVAVTYLTRTDQQPMRPAAEASHAP
jgi:F1F0 ATPase subunit 2